MEYYLYEYPNNHDTEGKLVLREDYSEDLYIEDAIKLNKAFKRGDIHNTYSLGKHTVNEEGKRVFISVITTHLQ